MSKYSYTSEDILDVKFKPPHYRKANPNSRYDHRITLNKDCAGVIRLYVYTPNIVCSEPGLTYSLNFLTQEQLDSLIEQVVAYKKANEFQGEVSFDVQV